MSANSCANGPTEGISAGPGLPLHRFDSDSDLREPIEIRTRTPADSGRPVVVVGENVDGVVRLSIYSASGIALHQSTLQPTTLPPRKAVPGWQRELIEWVRDSLYRCIVEIR